MGNHQLRNRLLTLACIGGLFLFLWWAESNLDAYKIRLLNLSAIYIILAVSYNLINGVTGQFSLEPNAFIAIGAYTSSLLTMSVAEKEMTFIIEPLIWPLNAISIPFFPSLLIAGTVT
ncbi:MAG: branched-chain amino acid ABC transporter permease, partial [Nitrospinota bacterium]